MILKLASAGPRLYALTSDGKLKQCNHYHDVWDAIEGPEDASGEALRIVDFAVTINTTTDDIFQDTIYALINDGRLFRLDGHWPPKWIEEIQP